MGFGGLNPGPGPLPGQAAGEFGRAQHQGASSEHHMPSAEVIRGIEDEKSVRRLRRKLRFWRLFRRVR